MVIINIVVINGSKRTGNTYKLIKRIEEYYTSKKEDVKFSYINLGEYNINTCLGCEACIITDKCPLSNKDDFNKIVRKLIKSDKIILSSPVYLMQISGLLKTFIDRTCRWFHRPQLTGKPILVVSTTASSGLKNTIKYLESVITQWGAIPVGSLKRKVTNYNNDFSEKELKKLDYFINFDIKDYTPSFPQLTMYQVQKVLANKIIEMDKDYWIQKGWMNQPYFNNTNLPLVKKYYSNFFFKILNKKIAPVKK